MKVIYRALRVSVLVLSFSMSFTAEQKNVSILAPTKSVLHRLLIIENAGGKQTKISFSRQTVSDFPFSEAADKYRDN